MTCDLGLEMPDQSQDTSGPRDLRFCTSGEVLA
jgi:hypothetical protein